MDFVKEMSCCIAQGTSFWHPRKLITETSKAKQIPEAMKMGGPAKKNPHAVMNPIIRESIPEKMIKALVVSCSAAKERMYLKDE